MRLIYLYKATCSNYTIAKNLHIRLMFTASMRRGSFTIWFHSVSLKSYVCFRAAIDPNKVQWYFVNYSNLLERIMCVAAVAEFGELTGIMSPNGLKRIDLVYHAFCCPLSPF